MEYQSENHNHGYVRSFFSIFFKTKTARNRRCQVADVIAEQLGVVYNVYMIYGFNLLAMHNIRKDDHPAGHHSSMASQWLFKRMI